MRTFKYFFNKIIALIVAVVSVLAVGQLTAFSFTAYAEEIVDFSKTEVMTDLQRGGFDFVSYPADRTGLKKSPELINFVEYRYTYRAGSMDDYGLYLYFYNPQLLDVVRGSNANKVTLSTEYNVDNNGNQIPKNYEKYELQFCSVSTGTYDGLYYKYKIVDHVGKDGKKIADRVDGNGRRYDISEIELLIRGNSNATAFGVGGSYIFTGYMHGCGADTSKESTLNCEVQSLKTISIDLDGVTDGVDKHTYWRSNSSYLGRNHQNQINSVFFAVNKEFLKDYSYSLSGIKAEWYEYKTCPAVLIENVSVFNDISNFSTVIMNDTNNRSCPYYLYNTNFDYSNNGNVGFSDYNYTWNKDLSDSLFLYQSSSYVADILPALFCTYEVDIDEYTLSAKDLQRYFMQYDKTYNRGHLTFTGHDFSADLFSSNVDEGRTKGYNLRQFDITNPNDYWDIRSYDSNHNWWNKLLDYGFGVIKTDDSYSDIAPIYRLTDSDFYGSNISDHLFINVESVSTLKDYYNSMKKNYEVFLFRYAVTDYYAEDLTVVHRLSDRYGDVESLEGIAEVRQETVFFDFDILSMTFEKAGKYFEIPLVSSPSDHWTDMTPSVEPEAFDWFKLLFAIIALFVLLLLFWPILSMVLWYLVKGIIWLVALPFKLIINLFRDKR